MFSLSASSQSIETPKFRLYFSTGFSQVNHLDLTASQLAYRGKGIPLNLGFSWKKNNRSHSLSLDYQMANLQSQTSSSLIAQNHLAGFNWRMQKQFRSTSDHRQTYFYGFLVDFRFWGQEYQYKTSVISKFTGAFSANISPTGQVEWRVKEKTSFHLNLSLAVLSWVIRSGYTTTVPEKLLKEENVGLAEILKSGTFLLPHQFLNFQSAISLKYQLTNHTSYLIRYNFKLTRIKEPQQFTSTQDQFTLGILLSF